jgi:hypothetical protein
MEEITSINETYPNSRSESKSTHLHSSSSSPTSAQATVLATYIQTRSKSKQLISTTISPSTSNTCMAVEEITPNNHNNHATKKIKHHHPYSNLLHNHQLSKDQEKDEMMFEFTSSFAIICFM